VSGLLWFLLTWALLSTGAALRFAVLASEYAAQAANARGDAAAYVLRWHDEYDAARAEVEREREGGAS